MGFFKKLFGGKKKKEEEKLDEVVVNQDLQDKEEKVEVREEKVEKEVKPEEIKSSEKETIVEEKVEIKEKEVKVEEKPKKKKVGLFTSLKEKLTKTREGLFGTIKNFFTGRTVIDDEMYEELEDLLIQSDIGMDMTVKIVETLEKEVRKRSIKDPELVYEVLKEVMEDFLIHEDNELKVNKKGLNVVLVVGVNGVGKTTTIGKLSAKLKAEGKSVVVGAGDTFRAAAIEQLEEWATRADVELIKHEQGSDPGAVVYDTLKAAEKKGADVAIIDTAGRLHNKNNLMKELEKINKIINAHVGEVEYESLLVIDGTTGQNGLNQARVFNEVTKLTGFIITKLDGTAKGGIVFPISEELKKPIKFIGVGEGIEDLREFNATEYINAIFE